MQILTGALEKVLQLQPKTYFFKTDEYDHMNLATGPQMGFIAQEVQEIFPEVVKENVVYFPGEDAEKHEMIKTEYIGINYLSFVPILTKAIQEQQEIIQSQQSLIQELMDRLEKLEDKVNK